MSDTDDARPSGEEQQDNPFDANIYNLELGEEMVDFDNSACTPTEHEGRPAMVFEIGPHDEDVRKAQVCTECGMVVEETRFDDVVGITLEAVGGVRDRVHNYPGEQSLSKVSLSDVLELAGIDGDVDVTHAGVTGDELMIQTTEADDGD